MIVHPISGWLIAFISVLHKVIFFFWQFNLFSIETEISSNKKKKGIAEFILVL